ncbi:hypothetical protein BgiMline_032982 [Biomphalaria glabrata]|uniref:Uncharacterized protein n=1 Tax=Biomphalaria glabrata TaxID=6526 RepID=A0A2C9LFX4_BIOGL|nr:hypothetical protein BgiMline_015977 [Biomphalaria glabrata]
MDFYLLLSVVMFVVGMPLAAETLKLKRNAPGCLIEGRMYAEGETFNIPGVFKCIRYTCENGAHRIASEGCEWNGTCVPVNGLFFDGCSVKQCSKRTRNYHDQYVVDVVLPRCRDYLGTCRGPLDHYSDEINGRVFDSCHCYVSGDFAETYCD